MPFPWSRYWRRVRIIFVVAVVLSLVITVLLNGGRLGVAAIVLAVVDSAALAIVLAFPLTQPIYRGPRR